ncbi:putative multidrug resistance protein NorM [Thalassotalea eurytherma]|uniref:Multidrug-efflux transporter n=1 Tax=Thalassotalea eurytherma TaxID=1144278 RepID=A0ABQ6H6G1_9GAMM|nr:putative multidrug resistance protein NorM [Thalassotalea eurytherma]
MKSPHFLQNTKSLLKLAYPILIAQLIQNLMGFADTVMAGRVSSTDMAAVAVASSIWLPLILTIYGVIMALAAIVSQYAGSKSYKKIVNATYQTLWIALVLGVGVIALYYLIAPTIENNIELDAKLSALMFEYLGYIVWGAPGFCLYLALRNYAEGMSFTRPTMIISIIGLIVNIPANYIFIYGEFGMPALGGAGCGIATAIVYWAMFVGMLIYVYLSKHLENVSLFKRAYGIDTKEIKHILKVGVPIALSLLFEVSLFSVVAILLAPLGADIVASHQIAINFSGLVFMVPLSFAMALTIKVGYCVGQEQYQDAKDICKDAVIFGLMIAVVTALGTIIFREQIAAIYTNEAPVIELAASLMFLAALFQFSDAIQVISAGALRGYKDTTSILVITFISYWFIGLSFGVVLAMTDIIVPKMGAAGFWIGFISGLTVAAILLAWRLKIVQSRFDNSLKVTN